MKNVKLKGQTRHNNLPGAVKLERAYGGGCDHVSPMALVVPGPPLPVIEGDDE